jgi:hypothetical protein
VIYIFYVSFLTKIQENLMLTTDLERRKPGVASRLIPTAGFEFANLLDFQRSIGIS